MKDVGASVGALAPTRRGGEPLLLSTDALEGLAVDLLVHEPAGLRIALGPVPVRGLNLGAIADRADPVTITGRGVLSQ